MKAFVVAWLECLYVWMWIRMRMYSEWHLSHPGVWYECMIDMWRTVFFELSILADLPFSLPLN